ncbi:hypothetical protein [Mangrovimonas sp. YM274]|uniref:hypothetical protein n=1 Tax=Mangrovimonas sp. YM274 TaxID=3070660 RepID=UPI0027DE9F84|nr:hypothetical protein [Mangrovimonas sp. YM274]WMI68516.1 hypothetical protein RBH95_15380 [Mangrovimonas sp. YM274]
MKTLKLLFVLLCIVSSQVTQAQEDQSENKQEDKSFRFNLIAYGGIGYGIIENDNEPNYNLNTNTGDLLLNYRFSKAFGVATGIGYSQLTGNGFNSLGNFYHNRTLLKIPLSLTMNLPVTEKFAMVMQLGLYAQTVTKDEYRYLNFHQKDLYDGWNFGSQITIGFLYEIFDQYYVGLNYLGQGDFSKLSSNNHPTIHDKQKQESFNSIGITFMFDI